MEETKTEAPTTTETKKKTVKEAVTKEEFTEIPSAGFYTVNVDDGLTLPVIIEHGGEEIINMQHVKVTETVECGEETAEMKIWIKKGFLVKEKKTK